MANVAIDNYNKMNIVVLPLFIILNDGYAIVAILLF